jgi:hypothetical protein
MMLLQQRLMFKESGQEIESFFLRNLDGHIKENKLTIVSGAVILQT